MINYKFVSFSFGLSLLFVLPYEMRIEKRIEKRIIIIITKRAFGVSNTMGGRDSIDSFLIHRRNSLSDTVIAAGPVLFLRLLTFHPRIVYITYGPSKSKVIYVKQKKPKADDKQ